MKALLIAGTNSGSGKTTITLGLLRALCRRNLAVQPFKVGPDYIDTAWHTKVTRVPSHNLDAFMLDETTLKALFNQQTRNADIAVIEGVMGLYDGYGSDPYYCSGAGIAKTLGCPVILVVDGKAMAKRCRHQLVQLSWGSNNLAKTSISQVLSLTMSIQILIINFLNEL